MDKLPFFFLNVKWIKKSYWRVAFYCVIPHVLVRIDSYILCVGVQRFVFTYGKWCHCTHGNQIWCVFLRLWGHLCRRCATKVLNECALSYVVYICCQKEICIRVLCKPLIE